MKMASAVTQNKGHLYVNNSHIFHGKIAFWSCFISRFTHFISEKKKKSFWSDNLPKSEKEDVILNGGQSEGWLEKEARLWRSTCSVHKTIPWIPGNGIVSLAWT